MLMFKINNMKKIFYISIIALIASCTTAEIPLASAPVDRTVTYTQDIQPIMFNNCLTCHVSNGVASFLPLVNYEQVKNSAQNGNLIVRMNDAANPMPQSGLLTADKRALVDKWKADGYLE